MFQFPTFAYLYRYTIFMVGCPIRTSTDQIVLANPRSFSQLITSFFASESLGIPHTPLFCLLYLSCSEKQDVFFLLFKYFYLNMSMNGYLVEGQKSKVLKFSLYT